MSVSVYKKGKRINARNRQVEEMSSSNWDRESRLSMIQMLIPLGLRAVEEELQAEVRMWVGERYSRGSVYLGDQKVKINVPRVRDLKAGEEIRLTSYERLQDLSHLDEVALSRVINGVSQGRYERAAEHVPETFGIKKSSVSRKFIRASAKRLQELP